MKNGIYRELFTLVKNEGERLVVIDPDTDDGVVVMRLSEYKKLNNEPREMTLEQVKGQNTLNEPILAKNEAQNLSFWEHAQGEKKLKTKELDNSVDSGRIHECKNATTSVKEEPELVLEASDEKEESAGEEYYFEPAEEIGL